MKIEYKLEGLSELNHTIERSKWDIIGATKKATLMEAEEIMQDSVEEVPENTMTLRNSAFVEQDPRGDVTFGYGGTHAKINPITGKSVNDYMVAVHERLDVLHPKGKAKFLEDPVNRHKEKLESSLIDKIKRFFKF